MITRTRKVCPFCGGKRTTIVASTLGTTVRCEHCQAYGPTAYHAKTPFPTMTTNPNGAEELWNRRLCLRACNQPGE